MVEYTLDTPGEPITVGFAPLNVVMAAHFVHFSLIGDPEPEVEMKPILGVLIRHSVNEYGQVTRSHQHMAIQSDDDQSLCTPEEYAESCGNGTVLVGIYPYKIKPEPDEDEIEAAVSVARRIYARKKAAA